MLPTSVRFPIPLWWLLATIFPNIVKYICHPSKPKQLRRTLSNKCGFFHKILDFIVCQTTIQQMHMWKETLEKRREVVKSYLERENEQIEFVKSRKK